MITNMSHPPPFDEYAEYWRQNIAVFRSSLALDKAKFSTTNKKTKGT
jgi:hypothetical protein